MIRKANLHAVGIAYLRTQLAAGDYLAEALLNLPLESGKAFCFLPDSIDLESISLQGGGITNFEFDDDIREPLIEFAGRFLGASSRHLMMFELGSHERGQTCPWERPEYSVLMCQGSRHKMFRADHSQVTDVDSYYSLLRSASRDGVAEVLQYARPFPEVGILGWAPDRSFVRESGAPVDSSLFETLAQQTQHILIDAFDSEAYLVWSRNSDASSR